MTSSFDPSIQHPTLKNILALSGANMDQLTEALRKVIQISYGLRHWAILPHERRHRATLLKLVNLMDQIAILDDLDVYELGYACPEQIRRYHRSLQETLPIAVHRGIDHRTLALAEEAHTRLWQVMNEVTLLFDGLS